MVRASRPNLTSLLDVLLIVFFSFILAASEALEEEADQLTTSLEEMVTHLSLLIDASDAESSLDPSSLDLVSNQDQIRRAELLADLLRQQLDQLESQLNSTRTQNEELNEILEACERSRDDSTYLAENLERQLSSCEENLSASEASVSVLLESLRQDGLFEGLSPAAQRALQELLSNTITIVQLYIEDDNVREYRRYPEGHRLRLREAVRLTNVVPDPTITAPLDYPREYIGRFFPRLFLVLDNTYIQRSQNDRIFYLMVNESGNTCAGLLGLTNEIHSGEWAVVAPNLGGCH